jgi:hypothetical protein
LCIRNSERGVWQSMAVRFAQVNTGIHWVIKQYAIDV